MFVLVHPRASFLIASTHCLQSSFTSASHAVLGYFMSFTLFSYISLNSMVFTIVRNVRYGSNRSAISLSPPDFSSAMYIYLAVNLLASLPTITAFDFHFFALVSTPGSNLTVFFLFLPLCCSTISESLPSSSSLSDCFSSSSFSLSFTLSFNCTCTSGLSISKLSSSYTSSSISFSP